MKVNTGRVIGGKVDLGGEIADGTPVAILAADREGHQLTPAEESELSDALGEIERGDFEDGFSLLREIQLQNRARRGSERMTKLLEQAFAEVAKLPEDVQNRVAAQLLEELADEARRDAAFTDSADELGRLAAEALEEYRAGRTEELGIDQL